MGTFLVYCRFLSHFFIAIISDVCMEASLIKIPLLVIYGNNVAKSIFLTSLLYQFKKVSLLFVCFSICCKKYFSFQCPFVWLFPFHSRMLDVHQPRKVDVCQVILYWKSQFLHVPMLQVYHDNTKPIW